MKQIFFFLNGGFQLTYIITLLVFTKMIDQMIRTIKHYDIFLEKQLGCGNSGTVYKAINRKTKQHVAVKILSKTSILMYQNYLSAFNQQLRTMKLQGQNIVKLIDVYDDEDQYFIVQELCDNSLANHLEIRKKFSEDQAIKYLSDIASGYLTLLQANTIHRDIKPENILIKGNTLKLTDFTISLRLPHIACKVEGYLGSMSYMAPEVLKQQKYSYKCDIWSIGTVFYELVHGNLPWCTKNDNIKTLLHKIKHRPLQIDERLNLSEVSQKFLGGCLQPNEKKRFGFIEFFNHPIFKRRFQYFVKSIQVLELKKNDSINNLTKYLQTQKTSIENHCLYALKRKQFPQILSNADIIRIFKKGKQIINEELANFMIMRFDVEGRGSLPFQAFSRNFKQQKNTNKENEFQGKSSDSNFRGIENRCGSFIKLISQKNILVDEGFSCKSLKQIVYSQENLQIAHGNKYVAFCLNMKNYIDSEKSSLYEIFLSFMKMNPGQLSPLQKVQQLDMLGEQAFKHLCQSFNSALNSGEISELFDNLFFSGGSAYIGEKKNSKMKAVVFKEFKRFYKKILRPITDDISTDGISSVCDIENEQACLQQFKSSKNLSQSTKCSQINPQDLKTIQSMKFLKKIPQQPIEAHKSAEPIKSKQKRFLFF